MGQVEKICGRCNGFRHGKLGLTKVNDMTYACSVCNVCIVFVKFLSKTLH